MARRKKIGRLAHEGPVGAGKLDLGLHDAAARAPDEELDVIIKVASAGYVPRGVHVRGRITPTILTARAVVGDLTKLQEDPQVVSVAKAERLPPVKHGHESDGS